MEVIKKLIIVLVLIGLPVMSIHQSVASEKSSSSVTVSYTPDKIYAYVKLKVEVVGNGEVLDMGQPIRNGSITFDMQEGDVKAFEIQPNKNYFVQSVEYFNGYDTQQLKSQLKNHTISIMVKDQDAVLKIRFDKKSNSESDQGTTNGTETDSGKTENKPQGVQTDDVTNTEMILMLMAIALILMLIVFKKNRDSRDE